MKKLTYLVIATAALGMVACTGGNKAGYVVTGTVEGASDGDTVYLQEANGRNLIKLDTAVISKGTFTFEGTQDSVVSRYVTCEVNGEPLMIDFFLENVVGVDYPTAGVDNRKFLSCPVNLSVLAVASCTRFVVDNGLTALREPVEQGRFAYIGATYDSY